MKKLYLISFALFLIACGKTEVEAPDYQSLLKESATTIAHYYQGFDQQAKSMKTAANEFCLEPSEADLQTAQQQWKQLMEAYVRIEIFRMGPIREAAEGQTVPRKDRLRTWPAKGNRVKTENAVKDYISGRFQHEPLTADTLARRPTTYQGLDVLEYILFGNGDRQLSCFKDGDGAECDVQRSCQYLTAAADNIAVMADDMNEIWSDSYQQALATAGQGSLQYADQTTALSTIYNHLAYALRVSRDKKLRDALNTGFDIASPKKLEAWRSRHSAVLLKTQMQAILELYQSGGEQALQRLNQQALSQQFIDAMNTALASLNVIIRNADKPNLYAQLNGEKPDKTLVTNVHVELIKAAHIFEKDILRQLPVLDVFNEDDGD